MKKKRCLLNIFHAFFLFFLIFCFALPVEGGLACITIGIILLCIQLYRQSDFYISKAFILFVIVIFYLLIFKLYSKQIPITDITLQRILICFLLTLFMYISIRNDGDHRAWDNVLIITAIVVSLISIIELFQWYAKYSGTIASLQVLPAPQIAYRLKGNIFGHPNPLAGFLNYVWPIIFIRIYNSKESHLKHLWGILLSLVAVTFLYTNSRGALLGAISGAAFLFIAVIMNKRISLRNILSLPQKFMKQIGFAFGSISLLAIIIFWRSIYTGQFQNISFSGRGTIWKYSWDAFLESPLFGQGIGAFPISYTRLAQLPPGNFAPSAHNLWLQVSVNYGIIGFIFVCILMCVFLYYSIKTLPRKSTDKLSFKLAYISGGIAFLAQQTVDYMFVTTYYLIFSLVLFVLILKHSVLLGEWRLNKKSFALTGITIISLLSIFQVVVSSKLVNFSSYSNLKSLSETGNWGEVQEQVCSSSEEFPDNALYRFECSLAIIRQFSQQNQNNSIKYTEEMLDKAIFYQQSGYDINPYWAIQEANLAVLYWEKEEQVKAIELMEDAVNSRPTSDILLLNLGWMEEEIGNQEAATNYYIQALRLNPLINLSNFAQQSPLFKVASQDLINWGKSEYLWDSWYDNSRHDRGVGSRDHEYWKGVIALSTSQYNSAKNHFLNSIDSGNSSSTLYSYLAYAYKLDDQPEHAYSIAKDVALLTTNKIKGVTGTVELSIIASILLENGETELAYELLLKAYQVDKIKSYQKYYMPIYTQQFLMSDISPLIIRNQIMLTETQQDWVWLSEEALRKGDILISKSVTKWQEELPGIASP